MSTPTTSEYLFENAKKYADKPALSTKNNSGDWDTTTWSEFYNETMSEAEKTVLYKPNRAILFDGNTPHSIRPSSHIAPQYRFTLGIFFKQPNFIEEAKNNT